MNFSQKLTRFRMAWEKYRSNLQGTHERDPDSLWTILMADDDPDDFYLARDALKETGLPGELRMVSDGVELMDYLMGRGNFAQKAVPRPALILLDLNMPKKDGRETLREIKSHPELKRIPVVIYTTSKDTEDINACYNFGADSYITKPNTFESLVETMAALGEYWLGSGRAPALSQ